MEISLICNCLFLPRGVFHSLIYASYDLWIISHCRFSCCSISSIHVHERMSIHLFRVNKSLGLVLFWALSVNIVHLIIILFSCVLHANVIHSTRARLRTWLRRWCWESLFYKGWHLFLLYFQSPFWWSWAFVTCPCMLLGEHTKLILSG